MAFNIKDEIGDSEETIKSQVEIVDFSDMKQRMRYAEEVAEKERMKRVLAEESIEMKILKSKEKQSIENLIDAANKSNDALKQNHDYRKKVFDAICNRRKF